MVAVAVTINSHITIFPPDGCFTFNCISSAAIVKIKGITPAWYFRDSMISPFNKEMNARCVPHPGHSIPKEDLKIQVNK